MAIEYLVPRFNVKVDFEFDIGDRVLIKGSSIEGDVTGLLKDNNGLQYLIVYWYNGIRYTAWVFSREITLKR